MRCRGRVVGRRPRTPRPDLALISIPQTRAARAVASSRTGSKGIHFPCVSISHGHPFCPSPYQYNPRQSPGKKLGGPPPPRGGAMSPIDAECRRRDALRSALRALAGRGESCPLSEPEAAVEAACRCDPHPAGRGHGSGDVLEMVQYLSFPEAKLHAEILQGRGAGLEDRDDSPAHGHGGSPWASCPSSYNGRDSQIHGAKIRQTGPQRDWWRLGASAAPLSLGGGGAACPSSCHLRHGPGSAPRLPWAPPPPSCPSRTAGQRGDPLRGGGDTCHGPCALTTQARIQ